MARLSVCVVLLAACGASPPPARPPAETEAEALPVDQLHHAVFEVVVPKYEPAGVEYAEPLPVELLPTHERDDPYHSIGTAFTLDGTRFISAAHVFRIGATTQYGERRLRGADGVIHEIDQFVGHSGTRDLVVFTLREPPAVDRPLARGERPQVGATVYTVGSALGAGLSVRGGNVGAFTPEPRASVWEFIRYSAPTSPGNSGGPLLDAAGRVVGVVVQKSAGEHLDYAVPIEELDRLSSSRAELYARLIETESGERLIDDWHAEVELPASYATLAADAGQVVYAGILAHRAAFEAKFRERIFPTAAGLRAYLREQETYFFPAEVVRDAAGRWSNAAPTGTSEFEIGPGQRLYVGKTGGYPFVDLERPVDEPLATFVSDPQRVIDAMVKVLPMQREFAGVPIRVTAFGPAHQVESWRDPLGRPWISKTWRVWDDISTTLHCSPYPRGLACVVDESATSYEPIRTAYARINALRWTLSYDGRVADWIEYLALDPSLRPAFVSGAVTLDGADLALRLGGFQLALSDPKLSPASRLFVDVEYASLSPPALRVDGIGIITAAERGLRLRAERIAEPVEGAGAIWRDYWESLVGGHPPYDGRIVRGDDTVELHHVDPTDPIDLGPDLDVPARLLISCRGDAAAFSDKALTKACAAFRKRLAVAADP